MKVQTTFINWDSRLHTTLPVSLIPRSYPCHVWWPGNEPSDLHFSVQFSCSKMQLNLEVNQSDSWKVRFWWFQMVNFDLNQQFYHKHEMKFMFTIWNNPGLLQRNSICQMLQGHYTNKTPVLICRWIKVLTFAVGQFWLSSLQYPGTRGRKIRSSTTQWSHWHWNCSLEE